MRSTGNVCGSLRPLAALIDPTSADAFFASRPFTANFQPSVLSKASCPTPNVHPPVPGDA